MLADTIKEGFAFGVIILAAGASTRMGRPKLLLPWGQRSVLGHLLEQWGQLGPRQLAVVYAGPTSPVATELDRLGFSAENRIVNPAPERGMFSSIQCAAAWPGWDDRLTHWAIVLGDQPHLRSETLRRLIHFAAGHPEAIVQPRWNGKARHPVVLPRSVLARLPGSQAASLREFLHRMAGAVRLCEIDDPGLGSDLDTPADYDGLKPRL